MRTFFSTSVALLAVGSSLAAAHPHAHVEQADASLEKRNPEPLVLGNGNNNALGAGGDVESLAYSLGIDKRNPRKITQIADSDLIDAKGMKVVTNWANDFEKRQPHRKVTLKSDNDGIDAKGMKVVTNLFNDFEKRKATKITQVVDDDLIDLKGAKVVTNMFNDFEKRKATKVKQVVDDDLVDLKGAKVVTNWGNDFEKRKATKVTEIVDDDLIDLKGSKFVTNWGNDFEKRDPHRKVTLISDNDGLVDAKKMKMVTNIGNDFEKREPHRKVTIVDDNDLVDLKGAKFEFNALNNFERRSAASEDVQEDDALLARDSESSPAERRSFFSYNDGDILDLRNMGINLNMLNGKSHYCISLPHHFHYQSGSSYKSHHHSRPNYYKSNGHHSHHSCPSNYKHVSYQSSCGSAYYSDNDLLDLKDTSFNVCVLNLGGSCSNHADNAPRWKCTSRHGCCVRRNSHAYYASHHHHKSGTTVVKDNDVIDAKGSKVNINALNLGDKKQGGGLLGTGLLQGGTGLL